MSSMVVENSHLYLAQHASSRWILHHMADVMQKAGYEGSTATQSDVATAQQQTLAVRVLICRK